jgi:hypothetical protein
MSFFLGQPISLIPIQPVRMIGTITVQCVINETTSDVLTITKQPVQQGASITDHSFQEPTIFSTTIYQAANRSQSLVQIYQSFLTLQSSRTPFNIVTPKRVYNTMLIGTLSVQTDKSTENIISITLQCQQVILVPIGVVQVPRSALKNPGSNGATQPAGKKSALASLAEGIGALFGSK